MKNASVQQRLGSLLARILRLYWPEYFTSEQELALKKEENSALKKAMQRLEALEQEDDHDPFTGLMTQNRMRQEFQRIAARARRLFAQTIESDTIVASGPLMSMMLVTIDEFANFLQQHGPICSDEVIVTVTRIIMDTETVREGDAVAYVGSGCFLILLWNTLPQDARIVMDRIHFKIRSQQFLDGNGAPFCVTASAVVTQIHFLPYDGLREEGAIVVNEFDTAYAEVRSAIDPSQQGQFIVRD